MSICWRCKINSAGVCVCLFSVNVSLSAYILRTLEPRNNSQIWLFTLLITSSLKHLLLRWNVWLRSADEKVLFCLRWLNKRVLILLQISSLIIPRKVSFFTSLALHLVSRFFSYFSFKAPPTMKIILRKCFVNLWGNRLRLNLSLRRKSHQFWSAQ